MKSPNSDATIISPSDNVYINNNNNHTDDDEQQQQQNEPLFNNNSIKMGPFSIRYSPTANKKKKRYTNNNDLVQHEDKREGREMLHDFGMTPTISAVFDIEEYDGCDDGSELYESSTRRRRIPLRIILLALYLSSTLMTFWILDSIKEPTLAILVNGQLGKHQPRAKIVSFVVVIGIAIGMEYMTLVKKRRRRCGSRGGSSGDEGGSGEEELNSMIEQSWKDRNLPMSLQQQQDTNNNGGSGSGMLTKMKIHSSYYWKKHRHNFFFHTPTTDTTSTQEESSKKMSTMAFYIVGSLYIHFFITMAVALKQHPSFHGGTNTDNNMLTTEESDNNNSSNWYYPTLGYVLFALIESYGSISITIFWAFTNSNLTLKAAECHYGSIVALAQLGAIGGSTLSAILGRRRKQSEGSGYLDDGDDDDSADGSGAQVTPLLIFLACGCIGIGMAIMGLYARLFPRPMCGSDDVAVGMVNNQQDDDEVIDGNEKKRFELQQDNDDEEEIDESGLLPLEIEHSSELHGNISSINCTKEEDTNEIINNIKNSRSSIIGDLFGGVKMIFRHEYLTLVLAVSVLYEIALTCMHYEMNLIGLDRFGVGISIVDETTSSTYDNTMNHEEDTTTIHKDDNNGEEEITYIQFMGWYGQTVNILSLFLSYYAFPRLIKNYGLRNTIRIFPTVLLLVTIFAFVLFPQNLYFLFISLSLCKALTYSIHDPSEEVLYMPTSDDAKFRAKFWIDVVGQRIAKAIGSVINNYAGSIERIVKYGSLPSVVASLALWLACYQVGVLFDKLIRTGEVVAAPDEDDDDDDYDRATKQ